MRPLSPNSEVVTLPPHVAQFLSALEDNVLREGHLASTPWCGVCFPEPSPFSGSEISHRLNCVDEGATQDYVLRTTHFEHMHDFIHAALNAGAAEVRFAAELTCSDGQDAIRAVYANRDEEWHALATLELPTEWKVRTGTHFRPHFRTAPLPQPPLFTSSGLEQDSTVSFGVGADDQVILLCDECDRVVKGTKEDMLHDGGILDSLQRVLPDKGDLFERLRAELTFFDPNDGFLVVAISADDAYKVATIPLTALSEE